MSEPDLTAEPDAAEEIAETEWGVRYGPGVVGFYGAGPDKERWARLEAASKPGVLVRRTVSPWEEVP